jgi:hypothetical protein
MEVPVKEELQELGRALAGMSMVDLGYPMAEHEIRTPSPAAELERLRRAVADVPPQVMEYYSLCDGAALPDVQNGYFLHSIKTVLTARDIGEPNAVSGPNAGKVLVMASDGGGGRFAVRLSEPVGEIIYLPSDGGLYDGVFNGTMARVVVVAADLAGFVLRLSEDVKAFVRGDEGWKYLA